MAGTGSCPCHPDIEDAITAHRGIVEQQARGLVHPGDADYANVISDGMLALWRALTAYDPDRGDLELFLKARVRFRMIDGLRGRTGRGAAAKPPTVSLLDGTTDIRDDTSVIRLTIPDTTDALDALGQADEILAVAAAVDPRLPQILRLLADGYNRTEAGAAAGVSRTRVWQLMSQLTAMLADPLSQLTRRASA